MGKVISIVNQKGGVGKTTTAINLSAALALNDKKALLIDFDPQSNTTSGLGIDYKKIQKSIYHVLLGEVPGNEIILKTDIDNLKSSVDSGIKTIVSTVNVNRWILIAGLILLAALHLVKF